MQGNVAKRRRRYLQVSGGRWAVGVTGRGSAWQYLVAGPLAFDLWGIFRLPSRVCITPVAARLGTAIM